MAAGDTDTVIVENPTALTVSTALTTMVAALNTTMRYTVTPLGMGKGVMITGIAQAQFFKFCFSLILMTNPNKGTKSTKEIDKNYDENETQGRQINLVAEGLNGIKTRVFKKEKVGL